MSICTDLGKREPTNRKSREAYCLGLKKDQGHSFMSSLGCYFLFEFVLLPQRDRHIIVLH